MKTKVKKSKTISQLDKTLWPLFSEYIRRRAAKEFSGGERAKCFTCEFVGLWKYDLQAGHFMPRQHKGSRYDEKGVQAQCKKCNCFEQGNQLEYARQLDKKYGKGTADLIELKSKSFCKPMPFEYEKMIEEYKEKLKTL